MTLAEDQIHDHGFQKISDYIWSPNLNDTYVASVVKQFPHLKVVNKDTPPGDGIIFIGMAQIIEDIYQQLPREGNYTVIHRPSDRSYTKAMHIIKPDSVKRVFSVNAAVDEVTAIPFGTNSISGHDHTLERVAYEPFSMSEDTKIYCRYNVNRSGYTQERIDSIPALQTKPFVKVVTQQVDSLTFMREVKAHPFTMSLQGCGKDCARTWAAITLGSIPIVTDCPEMRRFEGLPMVFCPPLSELTEDWLTQAECVRNNPIDQARMSYWTKIIKS